jgi:anti-anti-sigma regulatory factor
VQLVGDLDAHTAEALRLQIRRLARQHGVDLTAVTIETEPDEPTSA